MRFILSATKQFTKALVLDSVVMVGVLTKKSDIVEVAFVSSKALCRICRHFDSEKRYRRRAFVSSNALCRIGKIFGLVFFGMSKPNHL